MDKYLKQLLIFIINFGILIFAKESNDAEFTNLVCYQDNITFVNISCRLVSRRYQPRKINVELDIIKPIKSFNVHFQVLKRLNGYHPFVLNYTFDGCKALKNQGLNPMTRLVKMWILENSNLKIPCPIQMQHFQLKELYPDLRLIPSIVPKGRYRADIKILNKTTSAIIAAAELHFTLKDNF